VTFSYPPDVNADGDSVLFLGYGKWPHIPLDMVLEKFGGCGLSESFYWLSKGIN
jgi:hypothetical protein